MNPCPCGEGTGPSACRCSEVVRARYTARVSGPLLDRFDLRVTVDRPEVNALLGVADPGGPGESTATVARRVAGARTISRGRGVDANASIPSQRLDELAPLDGPARHLLETKLREGRLSARGLHRVRRVARTIADLGGRLGPVGADDVYAALALRADPLALEAVPA